MDAENVAALETLSSLGANGRRIVLRLKDLTSWIETASVFCAAAKRSAQLKNFRVNIPSMDGKGKNECLCGT
jgi:hypothetical protein